MFQLAPQGARGPVCPDLPPALLPHAIAAAAPPRDRARSLLLAGAVYLALAGSGVLLARASAVVLAPPATPTEPPPVVYDWDLRPAPPEPLRPTAPAGPSAADPAKVEGGAPQALPQEADPSAIPTGLPTRDASGDRPAPPVGAPLAGPLQAEGSAPRGPAQVRFIDTSMVHVLQQVTPVYPALARMTRIQGAVVLLMTIDERGVPTEVQVLEGHPGLQEAALQAARQWRFEPARVDGRAVPASFRLTLNFRLK